MKYKVVYKKKAIKELDKLDNNQRLIILSWIEKNLVNTEYPRQHGESLKGNLREYWRYRVGDFRLISTIDDEKIIIHITRIAHRRQIYKR